ncbi:MAG: DUF1343 domain-containing protein [Verrucomicrobiae bacterium]|nr:DUF1343 domain-containing protein [Verrucomicrobiae bacterium]
MLFWVWALVVMAGCQGPRPQYAGRSSEPPKPTPPPVALPTREALPPAPRRVLNGIDVLQRQGYAPLRGLRVGLITNHTGTDRQRNSTIDLLHQAPGVKLMALFSPEHGLRGTLDEKVADGVDSRTGLPVYSLYGVRQRPAPEQLKNLDALVFDIQDIGCRFYTYISTLGYCLEAAAEAQLKFFVLDRVNPLGGVVMEGPVYEGEPQFVAFHALPLRHGMTVGELARLFQQERGWKVDLTVIPVAGWRREDWFDATGLPWINPSPNMRSLTQATLYPGVGLLEFAVSVGRGTDTPFEVVGAPYVNDLELAEALNGAGLPGIRFVPVQFTPTASVFHGQQCGGVNLIITDRTRLRAVDVGVVLVQTLYRLYPRDFAIDKVHRLLLDKEGLEAIKAGRPLAEIRRRWEPGLEAFARRRASVLLY